jgi:hypothetical protein
MRRRFDRSKAGHADHGQREAIQEFHFHVLLLIYRGGVLFARAGGFIGRAFSGAIAFAAAIGALALGHDGTGGMGTCEGRRSAHANDGNGEQVHHLPWHLFFLVLEVGYGRMHPG